MAEEKPVVQEKPVKKKAPSKKAAPKKTVKDENVVDIADFFTTTREKEGVWYELKIQDIGIGIEVKLYGKASPRFIGAMKKYSVSTDSAEKETDIAKKSELTDNAEIDFVTSMIGDARVKEGSNIKIRGKEFSYSSKVMRELFYENKYLREDAVNAIFSEYIFMK